MSQLSSSVSLPQIAYKGIPVVTTETLARAYEVKPINIQKNFSANKDRFVEGRHYYTISGNDLRELKHRLTESKSVKIARNVNALTLWTERGAARHAKMLNSDKAWDMFELLEETFFAVVKTEQPAPSPISKRTDPERKALTAIINTWVGMAPIHYASARAQVNAHFGVTSVDALTVADSLDAATDNIGRCYTAAKPLEKLIEELRAQKGSRYAPAVVELFDDPDFCTEFRRKLYESRQSVYLEVYRETI